MPSSTFLHLDPEKRGRFFQAALDEFSARPYDQASISAIVRRLGIAKGSVYQYFDDKFALFAWLLEEAAAQRAPGPPVPADADLFTRFRLRYRAGLADHVRDPRPARVGLRLLEPSVEPRLVELRQAHVARVTGWLTAEFADGIRGGVVRGDVDPALAAHLARGLLHDGLLAAFSAALGDPPDPAPARVERALAAADEAVDWLERALRPSHHLAPPSASKP
jgi:AcrR family transcriptional regulator